MHGSGAGMATGSETVLDEAGPNVSTSLHEVKGAIRAAAGGPYPGVGSVATYSVVLQELLHRPDVLHMINPEGAKTLSIHDTTLRMLALANAGGGFLVVSSPGVSGDTLTGLLGVTIGGALKTWSTPGQLHCKGWQASPPIVVAAPGRHTPAGEAITVIPHVINLANNSDDDNQLITPDRLQVEGKAIFVLVVQVRRATGCAMLTNLFGGDNLPSAINMLTRVESLANGSPPLPPAPSCCSLNAVLESTGKNRPMALDEVRDVLSGASGSQLLADMTTPALDASVTSAVKSLHWRPAGENGSQEYKRLAYTENVETMLNCDTVVNCIAREALAHSVALTNLHGGGSMWYGICDADKSIEGLPLPPHATGAETLGSRVQRHLRRLLRHAIFPWRDEFVCVIVHPVEVTASQLAAAAGSIVVAEFANDTIFTTVCRAHFNGSDSPLPLVDEADEPGVLWPARFVFRGGVSWSADKLAFLQSFVGKEVAITFEAECLPLPEVSVVEVRFTGVPRGSDLRVCSRLDVAAPIACGGTISFMPFEDIIARRLYSGPSLHPILLGHLTNSSALRTLLNVTATPASLAVFQCLNAIVPWNTVFDLSGGSVGTDLPYAESCSLTAAACTSHLVIAVTCGGNAGVRDMELLLRDGSSFATLLKTASSVQLLVFTSHVADILRLLHGWGAGAANQALVIPLTHLDSSLRMTAVGMPVQPPPLSLDAVRGEAIKFLEGHALRADTLRRLLMLPQGERVDALHSSTPALAARMLHFHTQAAATGKWMHMQVRRMHVAAGACIATLRVLCDLTPSPPWLLLDDMVSEDEAALWLSNLPPGAIPAVVVHERATLQVQTRIARLESLRSTGGLLVTISDRGGTAGVPIINDRLDEAELLDAARVYTAAYPERKDVVDAFVQHVGGRSELDMQRSLTALAVATHVGHYVPLQTILDSTFSGDAIPSDWSLGTKWLVLCSVLHAFQVVIVGATPRLRLTPATMGAQTTWQLSAYAPNHALPRTVHPRFAELLLQRAVDAAAGAHTGSCTDKRARMSSLLDVLRMAASLLISLSDEPHTRPVADTTWYHLLVARPDAAPFSNLISGLCHYSYATAVKLFDHARLHLAHIQHSASRSSGWLLLMTAARVWRAQAAAFPAGEEQHASYHRAMQCMLACMRTCDDEVGALTVNWERERTGDVHAFVRDQLATASRPYDVVHCFAVIAGVLGIHLGYKNDAGCQSYVAAALVCFHYTFELDTRDAPQRGKTLGCVASLLRNFREYMQKMHRARFPGLVVSPDFTTAYGLWSSVIPTDLGDYLQLPPAIADTTLPSAFALGTGAGAGELQDGAAGAQADVLSHWQFGKVVGVVLNLDVSASTPARTHDRDTEWEPPDIGMQSYFEHPN